MQKLVWQNANGDSIDLTSGNYGITQWEGFSNTSLNIQSQQVPFQDGAVFLDALLNQRELSVTLKMQDNGNLEERYRMRRELIHILNPKLGEGYLIYTNDFISKRIKCVAQIPLFETHNSDTRGTPKASLSWTACEPYWEDLLEQEIVIKDGESVYLENNGDLESQIIAEIYGLVSNPSIINQTTKKKIKVNIINNNNPLQISTEIGNKYVKDARLKFRWNTGGTFYCCYTDENINIFAGSITCIQTDFEELQEIEMPIVPRRIIKLGSGQLLAVGDYIVCRSETGFLWEKLADTPYLRDVVYNDGVCIGVGSSPYVYKSTNNGTTWLRKKIGENDNYSMYAVCYHNGSFYACGNRSNIIRSSNATDWNYVNNPLLASELVAIAQGNGLLIVGGNVIGLSGGILGITRDDGTTWEQIDITEGSVYYIYFDESTKNFLFSASNYIFILLESENYSTTRRINVFNNIYAIAGTKNSYYAVGQGIIKNSNDNIIWENSIEQTESLADVIKYNESLIGIYDQYIKKSEDGINWVNVFHSPSVVNKIIKSKKNIFVIAGYNIYRSNNGENFELVYTSQYYLTDICFGEIQNEEIVIAVGAHGLILYTNNEGNNWQIISTGLTSVVTCVIFANQKVWGKKFFAPCQNGAILRSYNGTSWINVSQSENVINTVATNNEVFVSFYSVKVSGSVYTPYLAFSNDCIHWQLIQTMSSGWIKVIDNQFFISGIKSSYDGLHWNDNKVSSEARGLYESDGKLIVYGNRGIKYTSEIITLESLIEDVDIQSNMDLNIEVGKNVITFKTDNENQYNQSYTILKYRQKYLGV